MSPRELGELEVDEELKSESEGEGDPDEVVQLEEIEQIAGSFVEELKGSVDGSELLGSRDDVEDDDLDVRGDGDNGDEGVLVLESGRATDDLEDEGRRDGAPVARDGGCEFGEAVEALSEKAVLRAEQQLMVA